MRVTVYLDVFFFWNVLMNYVLLAITGKFRRYHISWKKRIFTACGGAFAACAALMLKGRMEGLLTALCYMAGFFFMLLLTFGYYSFKQFAGNAIAFFTAAFSISGLLLLVMDLYGEKTAVHMAIYEVLGIKKGNLILGIFQALSIGIPALAYWYFGKVLRNDEPYLYQVTLKNKDKEYHCTAFLDSGNMLVHPYTGAPVILMEHAAMEQFLNHPVPGEGKLPDLVEDGVIWQAIPFHSAGKEHGILWGIKLDYIMIERRKERWRSEHVIAASCDHLFSGKKEYQMLLHKELIGKISDG